MSTTIKDNLIFRDLEFINAEEAITFLANNLYEKDLVTEDYIESILERESIYPTGLPAKISVAIPHTDSDYVKVPSIIVGVLNKPVEFKSMEDPKKTLDVQLIIMLAVKDSSKQIELLQNVITLIQNEEDVRNIIISKDKSDIKLILEKYI